nr:MAG TPA: hypothetical protein [Caudoviricetes sp.]
MKILLQNPIWTISYTIINSILPFRDFSLLYFVINFSIVSER